MNFLGRFCLLMLLPMAVLAVPNTINYQGRLLDSAGIPVGYPTAVNLGFVIDIWNDPTATTPANKLYEETQTVNVNDGVYAFQIGAGTPSSGFSWNPTSLFNTSSPRYVELTIGGNTLTPRFQLLSAPFTLQSGNTDNLGGQPPSYYATLSQVNNLQGQIDALNNMVSCNQHANTKWSNNQGFCFGGSTAMSKCKAMDFSGEAFPGVLVTSSDCTGSSFKGTDFTGATFTGSTLMTGADFSNTNMTNVTFQSSTDLSNVISTGNKGAPTIIWNNGVKCPDKYILTKVPSESCLQHGWVNGG